jgi:hypothetical protein
MERTAFPNFYILRRNRQFSPRKLLKPNLDFESLLPLYRRIYEFYGFCQEKNEKK